MTLEQLATYDALARFFAAVVDLMGEWGEIETSDLWDDALKFGLAERVPYDPETHGEMDRVTATYDAEPGDDIYVLSALGLRAIGRANDLRQAEK